MSKDLGTFKREALVFNDIQELNDWYETVNENNVYVETPLVDHTGDITGFFVVYSKKR